MTLLLDTGALIALERNDRDLWATLAVAARRSWDVLVPSSVVAQAWRGTRSQALLGKALHQCDIAPFDPLARAIGDLCGRARTSDICDAHVALVAVARAEVVYTSDTDDIGRLIATCRGRRPRVERC